MSLKMSHPYSQILGRHIDPGEELSNLDIVKLMTNDRHSEINELRNEIKETMDEDRNHNKCMIKLAVEGLCRRLDDLEKFAITKTSENTNKLADLVLKQDTVSLYQEQLIDNMNYKIHDIMKRTETSNISHMSEEFSCAPCELTFPSKSEVDKHQNQHHVPSSPCLCSSCGETFKTSHDLDDHIPRCTPSATHEPPIWHAHETYSEPQHPPRAQYLPKMHPCNICGKTFLTCCDLTYHIEASHNIFSYHQCGFCGKSFNFVQGPDKHTIQYNTNRFHDLSPNQHPDLQTYLCYIQGASVDNGTSYTNHNHSLPIRPVHCNSCDATFTDMRMLNIHTLEYHRVESSFPNTSMLSEDDGGGNQHSICDSTFTNIEMFNTHIANEHRVTQEVGFEKQPEIPQFDGIYDDPGDDPPTVPPSIPQPQSVVPSSSGDCALNNLGESSVSTASLSVLHVPYQLNQRKQVNQLARDTSIDDIEITTNDSDRNVNIQCSTGFYEAVAKPALSSMSTSFSHSVSGVNILCTVFRKTQDQNLSFPGLFLRFELSGVGVQPNPAPLSVHLHNTQRKVQLQGGGLMPDKSKAPVWFLENVLRNIFTDQARAKKVSIDHINRKINCLVKSRLPTTPTQSSCSHCKKRFNALSKPVSCQKCSLLKHSTKCSPCPLTSRTASSPSLSELGPTGLLSVTPATSSTHTSVNTVSLPSPLTVSHGLSVSPRSNTAQSLVTAPTVTVDPVVSVEVVSEQVEVVPEQVEVVPEQSNQQINTMNQPSHTRKPRKSKQTVLPLSREEAEIAFLKQELGNSHTRITMLDSEIDDLNKTIKIQKARLKIFEDAKNSDASDPTYSTKHLKEGNCLATSPPTSCCRPSPPPPPCWCRCYVQQCQTREPSLSQDILNQISGLATEIEAIKSTLHFKNSPDHASQDCSGSELAVSSTPPTPADGEQMVVDTLSHEKPADISVNSIEEFLPTNHEVDNLNFNPLTIQLE